MAKTVTPDTLTAEQWDAMRNWRRPPVGFSSTRLNSLANIADNPDAWPSSVVAHAKEQLSDAWNLRAKPRAARAKKGG